MKRIFAFLLILLLSFFAYNAYTYHQLSLAEGAYKLAGIPSDEKLIAVYHDKDFWQFATYNEKTNTLKLYTVEQSFPLWLKKRNVESVKALVNYTPLTLDLKLLKSYEPHSKALLFKTLGWKYDYQINGSYWGNLSEVIHPGEECHRLLVFPAYESSRLLWVKEKPGTDGVELFAYYPGVILRTHKEDWEENPSVYTIRDEKIVLEILRKLEKEWGMLQVVVAPGKYASGSSWGSQYCIVGIPWGSNQTEVGEPYCRPAKWLSLRS